MRIGNGDAVTGRFGGRGTVHPGDSKMGRIRKWVLARDRYMCGICGHAQADGVDHIVPAAECEARAISLWDSGNLRAAHSKVPCPTCSAAAGKRIYCNALRSNLSTEAARLKLSKLTGARVVDVDAAQRAGKPKDVGERPW